MGAHFLLSIPTTIWLGRLTIPCFRCGRSCLEHVAAVGEEHRWAIGQCYQKCHLHGKLGSDSFIHVHVWYALQWLEIIPLCKYMIWIWQPYFSRSIWRGCSLSSSCQTLPSAQVWSHLIWWGAFPQVLFTEALLCGHLPRPAERGGGEEGEGEEEERREAAASSPLCQKLIKSVSPLLTTFTSHSPLLILRWIKNRRKNKEDRMTWNLDIRLVFFCGLFPLSSLHGGKKICR